MLGTASTATAGETPTNLRVTSATRTTISLAWDVAGPANVGPMDVYITFSGPGPTEPYDRMHSYSYGVKTEHTVHQLVCGSTYRTTVRALGLASIPQLTIRSG